MDAVRQSLITKRAELDAQMSSVSPDKGKIESLSREIGELEGKMRSDRADLRAQLDKEGLPMGGYGMGTVTGWGIVTAWATATARHAPRGYGSGHGYGHGGRGGCWR